MDRRRRRTTPEDNDDVSPAGAAPPSSAAPSPITPAIAAGLSALAARVQRIERIVQIRGVFERVSAATTGRIMMRQGGAKATIDFVGDTKLVIVVAFRIEGDIDRSPEQATAAPVAEGQRIVKPSTNPSMNAERLVNIDATYVIVYELLSPSSPPSSPPSSQTPAPTREVIEHFARRNAVFNVMPFWRAFVATAMARTGLPPVMVPPMKTGGAGAVPAAKGVGQSAPPPPKPPRRTAE